MMGVKAIVVLCYKGSLQGSAFPLGSLRFEDALPSDTERHPPHESIDWRWADWLIG